MKPCIAGQIDRAVNRTVIGCIHKEQLCDAQTNDVGQACGNPILWRLIARGKDGIDLAEMAQRGAKQLTQEIAIQRRQAIAML